MADTTFTSGTVITSAWANDVNDITYGEKNVLNAKIYGLSGDGITDDTDLFEDLLAELPSGGSVFFPAGTYLIQRGDGTPATDTIVSDNITIFGEGAATIFTGKNAAGLIPDNVGGQQYCIFKATSRSNITFKDISFEGYLTPIHLDTCTDILIDNIRDDGLLDNTSKYLRDKSIYMTKCVRGTITNSFFKDLFFGVYLFGTSTDKTTQVTTTDCHFEHTVTPGNYTATFPVGVYWVYTADCSVENCIFKNIYSSVDNGTSSTGMGYGVYEGDGLSGGGIISNNTFKFDPKGNKVATCVFVSELASCVISDNSFIVGTTAKIESCIRLDAKTQEALYSVSDNNIQYTSTHPGYAIWINAANANSSLNAKYKITDNHITGAESALRTYGLGSARYTVSNNVCYGQTGIAMYFEGEATKPAKYIQVTNNTISACGDNAMIFVYCISPVISGNTIIDGNLDNNATDNGSAILFSTGSHGVYAANNVIKNTPSGGGVFTYGFQNTTAAASRIYKDLFFNNTFEGFDDGEGYGTRYFATTPTNGFFDIVSNDFVLNTAVAAAGAPGWHCVKTRSVSVTSNASSASTTVTVSSTSGFVAGDLVLLCKGSDPSTGDYNDTTKWHVDTIASVTNGTQFVLNTGIPAGDGTYTANVAVCKIALFKAAASIAA